MNYMTPILALLAVVFLEGHVFGQEAKPGRGQDTSRGTDKHPDQSVMFVIETARFGEVVMESHGCTVQAKDGRILFVCSVRLTKAGDNLSMEEFKKLSISEQSKKLSDIYKGKVAGAGDFQFRMTDGTLVPCSCLPVTPEDRGPIMTFRKPTGEGDWFLFVDYIRVLGPVSPGKRPVSLVWGGKYEVAIPDSSK